MVSGHLRRSDQDLLHPLFNNHIRPHIPVVPTYIYTGLVARYIPPGRSSLYRIPLIFAPVPTATAHTMGR